MAVRFFPKRGVRHKVSCAPLFCLLFRVESLWLLHGFRSYYQPVVWWRIYFHVCVIVFYRLYMETGNPHYGSHAWPSMCSAIITIVPDDKVKPILAQLHEMDEETQQLGLRAFVWNIEESIWHGQTLSAYHKLCPCRATIELQPVIYNRQQLHTLGRIGFCRKLSLNDETKHNHNMAVAGRYMCQQQPWSFDTGEHTLGANREGIYLRK